jgi:TonB family protein
MKRVIALAFAGALLFHLIVLGFGGLLLFRPEAKKKTIEVVDLVSETTEEQKKDESKEAKPESEAAEEASDAVRQEAPAAPDLRELAALESPVAAPALAAMSLSDLESALGGGAGGGGEFGGGFSFASGGRIGGTGTVQSGGGDLDDILSSAELDQRPRPVFQASPQYPLEMRKKKVEGTVNVVFFVDKDGRVLNPQVENSSHPAFERPALEAVRQWRFDPGTRRGQKVSFKMRVPITFHVS